MPTLAAKEYCTGCTACACACPKGCITMAADENGFRFPAIDATTCVSCGLCEKVCPAISPLKKSANEPKAYAVFSKEDAVRLSSSSGGIFTELARLVLKQGGAVFGAAYNKRFEVVHNCVEKEADLSGLRGAKYAQSDLGSTFTEVKTRLDRGQEVLFSGTPCQVSGLKAFLRKDYETLLTVDFVCHSVPSPMAWQAYVQHRAATDNNGQLPASINLRSKQSGWTNYQYSNLFTYGNGHAHTAKSGESLYMKLFVGGYINRESCANCQFKGYSRVSDLTLGDFWGIWNIAPEMDDNKGTSVVLVQSPKGAGYFRQMQAAVVSKPVCLEEASRENQAILKAFRQNEKREEALRLIREGNLAACAAWFAPPKRTLSQRVKTAIKSLLAK